MTAKSRPGRRLLGRGDAAKDSTRFDPPEGMQMCCACGHVPDHLQLRYGRWLPAERSGMVHVAVCPARKGQVRP